MFLDSTLTEKYTSNVTPDPTLPAAEDPPETRSTAGMTSKVVKGSLWTLAGQIAPLGVSLFATPFVIRLLGADGYGVLILIGLIPGYLGSADFGMGVASTKFGSEAYSRGRGDEEATVVRTAAFIAICSAFPIALAIFLFSFSIVSLLNVPEHLLSEASLAMKLASVTFLIGILNNIFNTPQLSRLRMDLNTLVNSGFRILGITATPVVLYYGGGIIGAVSVLLAASVLTLFGHLYISGRLLPELLGMTIDRRLVRPLMKFGGALVGAGFAAMIVANLEKGILPRMVSVEALAYYSVAFTLASMTTMFSVAMIQSLIPAFSQLQGDEKREQLENLYSRGIRINLIVLVPSLVLLSIVAKPFFTIWAGPDFGRESITPFYILLIGLVFNIPAYLPYAAIMASGRTDIFAKLYFAELVPYLILVGFLTWKFGTNGAAAAWSIRIGIDAFFLFGLAKRLIGVTIPRRQLLAFAGCSIVMIFPFIINLALPELTSVITGLTLLCFLTYVILIRNFVLLVEERYWILNRLRRLLGS